LRKYNTNGKTYSPYSYGFPISFNLKKFVTEDIFLNFTFTYVYSMTDNIDDVSGVYQKIKYDSRGRVEATGRLSNGGNVQRKGSRSNMKTSDAFYYVGVTLSTRFDKNTVRNTINSIKGVFKGK
jgi:hypothetical protein